MTSAACWRRPHREAVRYRPACRMHSKSAIACAHSLAGQCRVQRANTATSNGAYARQDQQIRCGDSAVGTADEANTGRKPASNRPKKMRAKPTREEIHAAISAAMAEDAASAGTSH